MNLISYSLFKPRKFYDHRTWDDSKFNEDRYFFNIPALCVINKALYPSFSMRLTVCPSTEKNPLFSFYKRLSEEDSTFSYEVNTEEYTGHEPALWRIGALWEKGIDLVLSRDIDSVPNKKEYQATRFFEKSDYLVHTIRSHEHHFNYPCRMLIGLSGFRPAKIPVDILTSSFEDFKRVHAVKPELLKDPTVKWNADQLTIINAFTTNDFFTGGHFLDSHINNQKNYPDFFCKSTSSRDLNEVQLTSGQLSIIELIEKHNLTEWAGEPCDARGKFLMSACEIETGLPIMDILKENKDLEGFYLK
jgi:hypothetical protein